MSETVWRGLAEQALRGAPFDVLTSITAEGLHIAPLYQRAAMSGARAMRAGGAWAVAQRIDHTDAEEANRLALIDLEGGGSALTLVFQGLTARGYGLTPTVAALSTALKGIELDYISLRLDAGVDTVAVARALAGLTTARRLSSAALAVDIGLDPIGDLARTGRRNPDTLAADDLSAFISANRAAGLDGRTFLADGRPYHEAGAGEAQELAAVLATAIAYLRRLVGSGLPLSAASAAIAFLLVADADTFLSIAKFRALRILWARVEEACGLSPSPIHLHAETAWRMMTRHDPWVNVMRATAAVFAAGIGGADVIAPLPYTLALGLPEDGARRLARNTQLVLLEESHLGHVVDPAAGSGGLEALTDQLCEKAWTLFQDIEREGGIEASLDAGLVQARIAATAHVRTHAFATLEQGLTGTSTFAPLGEAASPLASAERHPEEPGGPLALPNQRDAAPFEALRHRADAFEKATGAAPRVMLATVGPPAVHGPRATYATNFFAAGGMATVTRDIATDMAAYDAVKEPLVCLCASDALSVSDLAETVATLRAAGARRVLLAGSPRVVDGLDGFIHRGCNALQILDESLKVFSRVT